MTDLEGAFGGEPEPAAVRERSDVDVLIRAYAEARVRREALDQKAKEARATEDKVAEQLFDVMERLNLRSVKHQLGTFSLNDLAWAKITNEDEAREWAKANMPELIVLNRSRVSVLVREHLRGERDDLPPGVDWTFSRGINWRRG